MLAYTLDRLLTEQCVIERNMAPGDVFGASTTPNWEFLNQVPCRLTWDRSSGIRSANRTYVSAARTVPMDEGIMVIPLGTDVTEKDRIVQILDQNDNVLISGVFTIVAVLFQEEHMELNVGRAQLGA